VLVEVFGLAQRVGHLLGRLADLADAVFPPALKVSGGTVEVGTT
jgi:hypothetical protein